MKNYRAIILGPQCSGKTTLKRYLQREHGELQIVEEDEIFSDLNGGEYPSDIEHKEKVLRPKLEEKIRQAENIIFLTSYCSVSVLIEFKSKGFKILQLVLERDEFDRRNKKRMEEEGYDDASIWAERIFNFHQVVRDKELVDIGINANQSIEIVANETLKFIEKHSS